MDNFTYFLRQKRLTITKNNLRKTLFYTSELNHHTFWKQKPWFKLLKLFNKMSLIFRIEFCFCQNRIEDHQPKITISFILCIFVKWTCMLCRICSCLQVYYSELKLKFPVKYYLTEEKNISPPARSVYRYHKSFKIIYTPYLRVWRHQYQKSAELCTWAKVDHRCACMVSNKWKVTLERTCKPTGIMVYTFVVCTERLYFHCV